MTTVEALAYAGHLEALLDAESALTDAQTETVTYRDLYQHTMQLLVAAQREIVSQVKTIAHQRDQLRTQAEVIRGLMGGDDGR